MLIWQQTGNTVRAKLTREELNRPQETKPICAQELKSIHFNDKQIGLKFHSKNIVIREKPEKQDFELLCFVFGIFRNRWQKRSYEVFYEYYYYEGLVVLHMQTTLKQLTTSSRALPVCHIWTWKWSLQWIRTTMTFTVCSLRIVFIQISTVAAFINQRTGVVR